jgi:hypothetical protein
VGRIQVQTPELALAASVIGSLGATAQQARQEVAAAQGEAAGFGGEPIGAAFLSMCSRATQAVAQIQQATDGLAQNVAMASVGYLNTDQGVVPISALKTFGGFTP